MHYLEKCPISLCSFSFIIDCVQQLALLLGSTMGDHIVAMAASWNSVVLVFPLLLSQWQVVRLSSFMEPTEMIYPWRQRGESRPSAKYGIGGNHTHKLHSAAALGGIRIKNTSLNNDDCCMSEMGSSLGKQQRMIIISCGLVHWARKTFSSKLQIISRSWCFSRFLFGLYTRVASDQISGNRIGSQLH